MSCGERKRASAQARAIVPAKRKMPKKRNPSKKKGVLPASPTPADWPYIGFDFVANAVGRYIPRL
jgi:hypothetical protein